MTKNQRRSHSKTLPEWIKVIVLKPCTTKFCRDHERRFPNGTELLPNSRNTSRCAGRPGCRDGGELDSGRRYRGILRCGQSRVADRIGDRRINRLIRKWLKAGVMEEGELVTTETGTPQGAVASPLLANIYLHYVFDLWGRPMAKAPCPRSSHHCALCR